VFQLVIPFCVGLGVRGGWQGVDGIRLEGDIGPMSVMALPLCLLIARLPGRPAVRLAAAVASAGALALIGLTYNRASAVAFVATLVALAWGFRRQVWILVFVGVTSIGAAWWLANSPFAGRFRQVRGELLGESSGSVSERLELWRAGRAMAADHPILGVGIGHYPSELALYAPHLEGKAAHNSYVQMAAETGIPGAALYVALFAGAVIVAGLVARRHRADATGLTAAAVQASLIGYLAASVFISRHDMVLAYILVGWVAALDLADRPSPGSGHSFE
jgi:O-antigen ligase